MSNKTKEEDFSFTEEEEEEKSHFLLVVIGLACEKKWHRWTSLAGVRISGVVLMMGFNCFYKR